MCFSSEMSFGASAVLSVIGIATMRKVQSSSQLVFASIPFLFALQQFSEGFLWLALSNPSYAHLERVTTYAFIFMAQVVWPLWVPLGVLLLDKKENRKLIRKIVALTGLLLSLILFYCLNNFNVHAEIQEHHIRYIQDYPASIRPFGVALYIISTIISLIVSKIKGLWILGITVLLSYIAAFIFFTNYRLSIWCFFASIISLSILKIIIDMKRDNDNTFVSKETITDTN